MIKMKKLIDNSEPILRTLFSYHPPRNEYEKELYNRINQATFDLAQNACRTVKDPVDLMRLLWCIHSIRMDMNASVCFDRIGTSWDDLFESEESDSNSSD